MVINILLTFFCYNFTFLHFFRVLFETQIEQLIQNHDLDAIFAVNEIFAVTAIKVAAKLNKVVPKDISIIGFTDGIISKYSSPSITTVSQNGIKMGEKAAKM